MNSLFFLALAATGLLVWWIYMHTDPRERDK